MQSCIPQALSIFSVTSMRGAPCSCTNRRKSARKITITAAVGFAEWKGVRINIIDTPGYINFLEETRGTLRAVDGAVLIISAISGVKAETEKIYKFACDYEIPRVAFVSKLDKERADFFRAIGDMEKYFCKNSLVLQLPIGHRGQLPRRHRSHQNEGALLRQ